MPFTFNPSMPDVTSRDAARVYRVGKYHALLVVAPPMAAIKFNPNIDKDMLINYLYAMVVSDDEDMKMVITSEITSNSIISIATDDIKNELRKPSICIFNEDGSYENLGKFTDWSNIELFCNKCFELIGERLGDSSKHVLLNNAKKAENKIGMFKNIKRWHFGKIIVLIAIYAMLLILSFENRDSYNGIFYQTFLLTTPPLAILIWIWLSGREDH